VNDFSKILFGFVAGVTMAIYLNIVDPANSRDARADADLLRQAADSLDYKDEIIIDLNERLKQCQNLQTSSEKEPMNYLQRLILNLEPVKPLPEFLERPPK